MCDVCNVMEARIMISGKIISTTFLKHCYILYYVMLLTMRWWTTLGWCSSSLWILNEWVLKEFAYGWLTIFILNVTLKGWKKLHNKLCVICVHRVHVPYMQEEATDSSKPGYKLWRFLGTPIIFHSYFFAAVMMIIKRHIIFFTLFVKLCIKKLVIYAYKEVSKHIFKKHATFTSLMTRELTKFFPLFG